MLTLDLTKACEKVNRTILMTRNKIEQEIVELLPACLQPLSISTNTDTEIKSTRTALGKAISDLHQDSAQGR